MRSFDRNPLVISRLTRRGLLGAFAAGLVSVPRLARADPWASDTTYPTVWATTIGSDVSARDGPDARANRLRFVRAGSVFQVLKTVGDWRQVYDPRVDSVAFIHGDLLTPAKPPSQFAFLRALPIEDELSTVAVIPSDLPLYFYPSPDPLAQAISLDAGDRETIVGTVTGDDGATWFETEDGYYLPNEGLFLAADPTDFTGRWLDVSLGGAAHVVAYDENASVRSFYAIKGTARYPTPPGTWSVVRRVANEIMDSSTLGIPRNGPGGYYLKNVLYTQYFRGTGESLHYNWWSSAWGLPGSHGCLGLSLTDARWLWDWAAIGTPVSIHA
jgi:hypothetical protein